MSQEALATVIKRALNDPAFRRRLVTDATALGGFDLTDNETAALRSGDPTRLSAFGIDQRMSKIFMVDPGAGGASLTGGVGSEPRDVEPTWVGGSSDAVTAGNGTDEGQLIPGTWDAPTDALSGTASEPRDIEPYWTGDGSDAVTGGAVEPRDIEPTDISSTVHGTHGEF